MADWRKVAMAAILADGTIDEAEVKVLKKELYADKTIDIEEVEFLIELRTVAQKKAKAKKEQVTEVFEKFFFKAISDHVLKAGRIDGEGAQWLRTALFADNKIDAGEMEFMTKLNKAAKDKSDEFVKLFEDAEKKFKKV